MSISFDRLIAAQSAYFQAFRKAPHEPWGVSKERIAEVLEQAVARGQPLPDDYDWWADLPPNAVS